MRIIFAGTPTFAVPCLQGLITASQYEISAVYTQPDRPAGRGQLLRASAIKQLTQSYQLTLRQPASLQASQVQSELADLKPDLMIVVAYGLIIPKTVLTIPKLGCINVHASLLPRWRGAAPIQRALLAGDLETGITLMQMDTGLDTGAMLAQQTCKIQPEDTAGTLEERLSLLGAECLLNHLPRLPSLQANAKKQNSAASCYANKIHKAEALLDWRAAASTLLQRIRAFNPYPIAFSFIEGLRLKIGSAEHCESINISSDLSPGTIHSVTSTGIVVVTGQGLLRITQLQLEGKRCMPIAALLNARPTWLQPGKRFEVN